MRVQITIQCDNAAFDEPNYEVARILAKLAEGIKNGDMLEPSDFVTLMDFNGNKVGQMVVSSE